MKWLRLWLSVIRPKTLPASVAPVVAAAAYAAAAGVFSWLFVTLALICAVSAQIASNLANDYFDYKAGADTAARVGPKRVLTTGEVSQGQMLSATCIFVLVAALSGFGIVLLSGKWWLLAAGVAIIAAAFAYSGGPYPLSRHALGDVCVILFFGVVAVNLTYYIQSGTFGIGVFILSLAVGLVANNILVVNNYRDCDEDAASGKKTTVVILGRKFGRLWYYWSGVTASFMAIGAAALDFNFSLDDWLRGYIIMSFYLLFHTYAYQDLKSRAAEELNPLLGRTAMNLLLFVTVFSVMILTDGW